jgi:hypothetical protein
VLAAGGAAGYVRTLLRTLGCAEYYVGSQGFDAVRLQFTEDASPNEVMLFLAESVDSRQVTGPEDNVPEPVRVAGSRNR